MRPLSAAFRPGRPALIAYLTAGYPSPAATLELVPALAEAGCDAVELGIPFSDPLADGTTIQRTSHQALEQGITPTRCLELAGQVSAGVRIPLLFMTYYNPVLRYGLAAFCRASAAAGVSGLIVPDLPPEEGEELGAAAAEAGLSLVYLLAPTSTPERIRLVAERSRGFIYLVSLAGVTGARDELPPGLEEFVGRVRKEARQPLCVGFGVSNPQQAARVARVADGVIVGSRLLQVIDDAHGADPVAAAAAFARSLRAAMDGTA